MFDGDPVPVALEVVIDLLDDALEEVHFDDFPDDNDPFVQMALDELEGWVYDCE